MAFRARKISGAFELDNTDARRALCFQMEKKKNQFCGLVAQESAAAISREFVFTALQLKFDLKNE